MGFDWVLGTLVWRHLLLVNSTKIPDYVIYFWIDINQPLGRKKLLILLVDFMY